MQRTFVVREARPEEHEALGQLMVAVYAGLEGFPTPEEQPQYYGMLADIGRLAERPGAELLVAVDGNHVLGGVVYFADMAQYGSGGTATREKDAAGFRLLAVSLEARGLGVGKALVDRCLKLARDHGRRRMVIHTTAAMRTAWAMYERMGFRRAEDLDFMQGQLQVYGFRLEL
jgi:GNAT superfamily N-acetyltransferase